MDSFGLATNPKAATISQSTSARRDCSFCQYRHSCSLMRNARHVVFICHCLFSNRILLLRCYFECCDCDCDCALHPYGGCCVAVVAVAGGCDCWIGHAILLSNRSRHWSDCWFRWLRCRPRFVRRPWGNGPSGFFASAAFRIAAISCWMRLLAILVASRWIKSCNCCCIAGTSASACRVAFSVDWVAKSSFAF
jgi:hypothetical protein